jgi:membrane-bound lytic murein transglycosylase C
MRNLALDEQRGARCAEVSQIIRSSPSQERAPHIMSHPHSLRAGPGTIANITTGRLLALIVALALPACSTAPSPAVIDAVIRGDGQSAVRIAVEEELRRQGVPADLEHLPELIAALSAILSDVWGEREPEVASDHRYVKYVNAYEARAIVDFEAGWLQVETVAREDTLGKLRDAVVSTLLTTRDMRLEDIFSDAAPTTDGEPFLLGQVLDADRQPIRWRWRAERFADYLLATALKTRKQNGRLIHAVRTDLVDNHLHLRELEYADFVLASAKRYRVAPSLIYAVVEVESAFNPYAISPAKAYGLMQIVPATAGRDVYARIKNRRGEPGREELFQPDFNIDIGSAYLHLLDDVYLQGIKNADSRRYASIAAYNGGASSALRTFDRNRDRALAKINRLSAAEVYARLLTDHPYAETRRYLEKVRVAQQRYQ